MYRLSVGTRRNAAGGALPARNPSARKRTGEHSLPTMDKAIIKAAIDAVTAPGEPYETTTQRVNGVDFPVFVNAPENLRELYRQGLEHGDTDFYVYADERYSFRDAWQHAAACANALRARGVQPGDRVGIALRNYPEWVFAFLGITSIGAVAVALNAWWSAEEMIYGIEDSGLSLLFADRERLERISPHAERLHLDLVAVRCAAPAVPTWSEFLAGASTTMPETPLAGDADATLLYTSGSTAHPKGVLSIHTSIVQALLGWESGRAMALHLAPELAQVERPFPPALILSVPLFHVTGLTVQLLSSFRSGRKLVAMYRWDAEEALRIIEAERITTFNGVPTMAWELVQSPNYDKYDLSSLASAGGGGAPMAPEQARQIDEHVGEGAAGTGWGLTETQGLATMIGGAAYAERPRSCGRPIAPLVDVKVVDADGNEVPRGATGELWIWGVMNFKAYWNQPEATSGALTDGWVHTGDLGHMDEDDYVHITDREKDMILRGGENIGCQEVEAVLYRHPGVAECAVFGVPDTRLGEAVAAVVSVRSDAPPTADDLRAHAAEHLAKFKVPQHVWLRTERLPRIASEKIYKRGLRDEAIALLAADGQPTHNG